MAYKHFLIQRSILYFHWPISLECEFLGETQVCGERIDCHVASRLSMCGMWRYERRREEIFRGRGLYKLWMRNCWSYNWLPTRMERVLQRWYENWIRRCFCEVYSHEENPGVTWSSGDIHERRKWSPKERIFAHSALFGVYQSRDKIYKVLGTSATIVPSN